MTRLRSRVSAIEEKVARSGGNNAIRLYFVQGYPTDGAEDLLRANGRDLSVPHRIIAFIPAGDGHVGKLYAVALTPDGSTVSVGGYTKEVGSDIYLFDRVSGALKQRPSGLPDTVNHLAYSKDGRYLAAALPTNGIRVFDVARGYTALPSDGDYTESDWVDFDASDRLVTASSDGFVRLYASGRYDRPVVKVQPRKSERPFSVAFSPDGQRIAVGFDDTASVVVLSAANLRQLYSPDVSGIDDAISSVAWSRDGHHLYAGGRSGDPTVVRRWDAGARGRHRDIRVSKDTMSQLQPLNNNDMLFAARDPSFGIIDSQGRVRTLQGPGQLDLTDPELRLSRDGKTVEVSAINPSRKFRFNLSKRGVDIDPAADASLAEAVTSAPGLSVSNWDDEYKSQVNGHQISLQNFEASRTFAIAPRGDRFVLGTEWYLRVLDGAGEPLWPKAVAVSEAVWAVNIPLDRQLVVAALGDGTVRWYRLDDGAEVLALFIHPDGRRWIIWTPQGYYDASAGADELVGWHANNSLDRAPDFYSVARFRDRFYRPDVMVRVLDTLDINEALRLADIESGRGATPRTAVVATLPPHHSDCHANQKICDR